MTMTLGTLIEMLYEGAKIMLLWTLSYYISFFIIV